MLFCARPYEHLYIGKNGKTICCSWGKMPLGNAAEVSIEDIWASEQAHKVRESIADGSFRYCNKISCPFLNNNSLPDLTPEEFSAEVEKRLKPYPTEFNLAYDFSCNHACPSCRNELFFSDADDFILMEKIANNVRSYFNTAKLIMACGSGELCCSRHILEMLSQINTKNENLKITIETNASIIHKVWRKIKNIENYQVSVTVTPNSFVKDTYKKLSGNIDNLGNTLDGLKFLSDLKNSGRIKALNITMVVQDSNFREIPSFIEKCLELYNPNVITLRPLMKWFVLRSDDSYYSNENLLNPLHPNHAELLDILNHPLCQHPRVYHWCSKNLRREEVD